jgi:hypothetical protein
MNITRKLMTSLSAACVIAFFAMGTAQARNLELGDAQTAEYSSSPSANDGLLQLVTKPCCRNDGRIFRSSSKTCYRYGGQVIAERACLRMENRNWRNDRNWNYRTNRFVPSAWTCRNRGGYLPRYHRCRWN